MESVSSESSAGRYSLSLSLREAWELHKFHWHGSERLAAEVFEMYRTACLDLERYLGFPLTQPGCRVLEIGVGQRAQNLRLFRAHGIEAVGIDLEPVGKGLSAYLAMARSDGPLRVAKSLTRALLYDARFDAALSRAAGRPLPIEGIDVRQVDAAAMTFPSASFDAVVSFSVFEHIGDVDGAVREVARVLKPHGVARILIHLFPSISGGHVMEWQNPDPRNPPRSQPWRHVVDPSFVGNIYLNGLKKRDYVEAFERHMQVESVDMIRSGEAFLTPDIERAASSRGYTREELLDLVMVVAARPRPASSGNP